MSRKKTSRNGSIDGSAEAKKATHVVLELLAGLKGPSEAAETLSVSLPRYYSSRQNTCILSSGLSRAGSRLST
jgi:hypothetical protein